MVAIRILTLINKDRILLKRNIYTGIGLAIFTPILLGFSLASLNLGVNATMTAYLSGLIYTTYILYFYIALEEAKYAKSTILLNSIFTKRELIWARYCFFLLTIITVTGIFIPLALIFKSWFQGFSLNMLLVGLSLALIFTSLFIPFTYRWTIDVTKYVISAFLLVLSFGGVYISKPVIHFIITSRHPQVTISILFFVSIVSYSISTFFSVRFFNCNR